MSLDDFYYSSEKRKGLAQEIHPLLATRGVPGTHDVVELNHVLTLLKKKKTGFSIQKFNKATDNPYPEDQWPTIEKSTDIDAEIISSLQFVENHKTLLSTIVGINSTKQLQTYKKYLK